MHKTAIFVTILILISASLLEVRGEGQFVGSVNSNVYHYPSCTYAQNIKPANQIWFSDAADAVSHGYRPCTVCNPPLPSPSPSASPSPSSSPSPSIPSGEIDAVDVVSTVVDGDTFNTTSMGKVRLADINAPEMGELGCNESKDFLNNLIFGREVCLDIDDIKRTDQYGRLVCVVYVEHNSSHFLNVNKALVVSGNAEIIDYTDNEFNPYTWSLYYSKQEIVPEFQPFLMLLLFMVATTLILMSVSEKKQDVLFSTVYQ